MYLDTHSGYMAGGYAMKRVVFKVEGMSCNHCANAVKTSLQELPHITAIDVNLAQKSVTISVDSDTADQKAMKEAIEEAGYEVI